MPTDDFPGQDSLTSSAKKWPTITPHDTNPLGFVPKAIAAGAAGNISMIDEDGNTMTLPFAAGEIKSLRPRIVKSTNTTATPIYGLR